MIYDSIDSLDFDLEDRPEMPRPNRVLMTTPEHFDVAYVINPHMEGKQGTVNKRQAREQWDGLKEAYANLGLDVTVMEGTEDQPDMVFCANQTLPFASSDASSKGVILSRMHAAERRDEVPHYEQFFQENGYETYELPAEVEGSFEGMGDALWHPGRRLIWGGYGFRTTSDVYREVSNIADTPVVLLHLSDDDFYHLDTCLSILDEHTALAYLPAFDDEGRALLDYMFDQVIDTPPDEARFGFACNAHCPDGEHVLIQKGCEVTNARLKTAGFTPVELDTSEFLKSGGSVFCMKLMHW